MRNRPTIGIIHVPRTGGTYLSRKLGCGYFDGELMRLGHYWHAPPAENIRKLRDTWISIVRNPYARMASEAVFFGKRLKHLQASDIPSTGHLCQQSSLAIFADWVFHYENLPQDFKRFSLATGIDVDFSDFSPRDRSASLSAEDKKVIARLYRDDFLNYGYAI